ncbi:MAG: hypothetical protein KDA41_22235, partial [Planctomycetales bacterium]|nr:hypothetical protein [Planctomycetales bacterium]
PLHHTGEDAQGLLANWTAMWHPHLVHAAGAMPSWARIDDPPSELAARLLLIPSVSAGDIPAGFAARAKSEGAIVIRKATDRCAIIHEALAALDQPLAEIDEETVADFLALGYCYLQVELLTRQMRYSSNLDQVYFSTQLVAAAQAAVVGDTQKTRELLQACFDVLGEERDHFYPVDVFLLDLTLVAETTIDQRLRQELSRPQAANLLLSGETLRAIETNEPETFAALREAVAAGRAALIGGADHEEPLAVLSAEMAVASLQQGISVFQQRLECRPHVYGRRRFGLSPALPQWLKKMGFNAALHATLDGGHFPTGSQTKTMWQGADGTQIDAIARPPLDAEKPETFLGLCTKLGESMDSDHVATLALAHWPRQACLWLDDLRRIAGWGPVLGKFVSVSDYFAQSAAGGMHDAFGLDYYRSPYLQQDVIRKRDDPISRISSRYARESESAAVNALTTLAAALSGDPPAESETNSAAPTDAVAAAMERFVDALPRASGAAQAGMLVANPHSFVRRICVPADELSELPAVQKPVYAVGQTGGAKHVIVDVPPMGFVWVAAGGGGSNSQKSLVEDGVLRNEYFEARIDESTGALRSVHDYKQRNNRISQQLALRMPADKSRRDEDDSDNAFDPNYSVMAADAIEVTLADAAVGEVVSRGRLVDRDGKKLAGFVQRFRVTRGSRVLKIDIELDPVETPRADAWKSYYACRFAWGDESADLYRTLAGARFATSNNRFESPDYVELDLPNLRTAILTGGLPYHRRAGMRVLDTLLIVRGETQRRFQLGIGIDLTHPLQEALGLRAPVCSRLQTAAPPSGASSGWLFHVDSKNVVATHWEPIAEEGRVAGVRVRLLEAYGRAAKVTLRALRKLTSAQKTDFLGSPLGDCQASGDQAALEMDAYEFAQVELRW